MVYLYLYIFLIYRWIMGMYTDEQKPMYTSATSVLVFVPSSAGLLSLRTLRSLRFEAELAGRGKRGGCQIRHTTTCISVGADQALAFPVGESQGLWMGEDILKLMVWKTFCLKGFSHPRWCGISSIGWWLSHPSEKYESQLG